MDHAIRLHNVGDRDVGGAAFRIGDVEDAASFGNRQRLALHRLEHCLSAALLDGFLQVSRGQAARQHVIGKHRDELILVLRLQQCIDGARGKSREGRVGRRKTVNGPGPSKVPARPAALTAATSVVLSLEWTAF